MTTLSELTDVTITAPLDGQRLVYEDGIWENQTVLSVVSNRVWSQEYYDAVYAAGPGSWSRPEWRTLPTVGVDEQKFVGLHAVFPEDGNFCALTCSGAYTVDWGDGVVENVAAGVLADHIYEYNDADLAGTDAPVTLTDAGDVVGRTAHGFSNGMLVNLWNVVGTTGPVNGQQYYVISATADTFQISLTLGGAAVAFTGDGTASLTRYKQAIVVVTPQVGQNLTALTLNVKHGQVGTQVYNAGWLDILCGSPNFSATGLVIGTTTGATVVRKTLIERVRIVNLGLTTTLAFRFVGLRGMAVIELPSTAAVTDMEALFEGCFLLQTVPLFNTAAVTRTHSMFLGCDSLQTVPLFNTAAVTSMTAMFQDCDSLQTVPLLNTAAVTSMSLMFSGCSSLQTVPLFNTAAVTNMASMFTTCSSLQTIPLFNTVGVTTMANMFQDCANLQTIPLLNTAAVTTMSITFNGCSALQNIPALVTSAVTTTTIMFTTCSSLARIEAKNFNVTFSVASCKLSGPALDEIYTNLPVVVGRTITVTGNYGTATDNPAIATAKGWTVTG